MEIKMDAFEKNHPWIVKIMAMCLMSAISAMIVISFFGQVFDPYPTKEEYEASIGVEYIPTQEEIDSAHERYEMRIEQVELTPSLLKISIEYFPSNELEIIASVASEYGLSNHETALLFAIRKIENGRPGLEFGCGDGIEGHPARRYANDFERSLRLQAQWCAGTIKKRYKGNVSEFSKIYCPTNAVNWELMAKSWLAKLG